MGGRAWTAHDPSGLPIELGCGWLHSADENELSTIAVAIGPHPRQDPAALAHPDRQISAFRRPIRRIFAPRWGACSTRLDEAGEAEADQPGDRLLEPGNRWNRLLDATSTYINGVELDQLSVHDFFRYRDTGVNWRITEGYGRLMAAMAADLDIVLDCPASLIEHTEALVRIATPRGDMRARAVIVTVPTDVLCAGRCEFRPALPGKMEAASMLPLGLADKLYLRLDDADEFPKDSHLYCALDTARTGSYHVRPFGRPLIEGYFGGRFARELEDGGEGAFASFAIGQLASLLGDYHPQAPASDRRHRMGARSFCARFLFTCQARACGRPRGARRAGRRETVLCRRGVLGARFLDRPRRLSQRAGGGR